MQCPEGSLRLRSVPRMQVGSNRCGKCWIRRQRRSLREWETGRGGGGPVWMRDEIALSSLSCDIEALQVSEGKNMGRGQHWGNGPDRWSHRGKGSIRGVGLRERGPAMMDERGQVPDSEGWLCPLVWTVSISRSVDAKPAPVHTGWGESLFTSYYRKLIWFD